MLALPGIVSLIVAVYLRPHEWTGPFAAIPFLQIAMGLTVLGLFADILLGSARLAAVPTLVPAVLLTIWCFATLALREPSLVATRAPIIFLPFAVYAILTQAAQSARGLAVVSVALLLTGLFIAVVGADQGRSEWGCVQWNSQVSNDRGVADGRSCPVDEDHTPVEAAAACSIGGESEAVYRCERVGAFAMVTVDSGRIAYLGVLADPNELALAISLAVPFAFALFEIRKTLVRFVLLLASLGFIITALVLTRSRGRAARPRGRARRVFRAAPGQAPGRARRRRVRRAAGLARRPIQRLRGAVFARPADDGRRGDKAPPRVPDPRGRLLALHHPSPRSPRTMPTSSPRPSSASLASCSSASFSCSRSRSTSLSFTTLSPAPIPTPAPSAPWPWRRSPRSPA